MVPQMFLKVLDTGKNKKQGRCDAESINVTDRVRYESINGNSKLIVSVACGIELKRRNNRSGRLVEQNRPTTNKI